MIEPLANTGFAGGCNLGIRAPGEFDLVALVNNDATVAADWLRPLVDTLATDEQIGAACPKILFSGRFQEIAVEVPDAGPIGRDERELGIRVPGVRFDGHAMTNGWSSTRASTFPRRRPYPTTRRSRGGRWSGGWSASTSAMGQSREWRCGSCPSQPRTLRLRSGTSVVEAAIDTTPTWIEIDVDPVVFDVINNVGSNLYRHGFGGDRGFLEHDVGQYEEPVEVFAWCGGAVLLRRAYLDDVGMFDEELFLYYEDTDLVMARAAARLAVPVRADIGHPAPPRPVIGRLVADVPLLHRTQPDARARQERAGAARAPGDPRR